jgi:hypothetical protein
MAVPSIKGAAIQSLFEDILQLEAKGRISAEELEARLEAEDLACLRAKLDVARWYPLTTYDRCTRLLCDHHGGDRESFLRQRGEAAGKRLTDSGIYPQLELADRIDKERAAQRLLADVKLMVTVFGSMLSVGKLVASQDEAGQLRLEIQGATPLPDVLAPVILGMVNHLATRIDGSQKSYRFERVTADLWVYVR